MPGLTPRQQLTERVTARFVSDGVNEQMAYAQACTAVNAFYNEEYDCEHWQLVAQEAIHLIIEVMPPAVTHMRAAFEQVNRAMASVAQAAAAAGPFVDIAMRLKQSEDASAYPPKFDASGLPAVDHPCEDALANLAVDPNRRGEPCIEEGCEDSAVPGTAFCRMCTPEPTDSILTLRRTEEPPETTQDVANEVSLADTGQPLIHFQPYVRFDDQPAPTVMSHVTGIDRITGAPHHYTVNGDHSECGCGGHAETCETWNIPAWEHRSTLCRIPRTNCRHYAPRHTYGQPCAHDAPAVGPTEYYTRSRPPVAGYTDGGEEVRGPAAG